MTRTFAVMLAAVATIGTLAHPAYAQLGEISCDGGIAAMIGFEPATPDHRPATRYPDSAEGDWSEGWVLLNFTVAKDGEVRDLIAIDAIGAKAFVDRTVRSFRSWRFKPARRNGVPVEQYGTEFMFEYRMKDLKDRSAVHRAFVARYENARAFIQQKKYAEAITELESAMKLRTNLYESAMASFALAVAHAQLKQWRVALLHVRRATTGEGAFLEPALHANAFALQVQLETDDGNYKGAVCAHRQLLKAKPEGDPTAARIIAQVDGALKNVAPLAVQGRLATNPAVEGPATWTHPLLRAKFHFAQILGEVKSFRLVCTATTHEAAIDGETQWDVPAAAGPCTLRVEGTPGATFHLVEEW